MSSVKLIKEKEAGFRQKFTAEIDISDLDNPNTATLIKDLKTLGWGMARELGEIIENEN